MNRKRKNARIDIKCERYDSFEQLLRVNDSREVNSWEYGNRDDGDIKWKGDPYDKSCDMLRHGTRADIKCLAPRNVKNVASVTPRATLDVVGFAPHVPYALQGIPVNMFNTEPCKAKRTFMLLVDISYSANVTPREAQERGRELLAYVQGMERAGYRVDINMLWTAQASDDYRYPDECYALLVNVKKASERLNVQRVAYPLTHASFKRQICFDWYERYPDAHEVGGHGHSLYYETQERRDAILSRICRGTPYKYFNLMNSDFNDLMDL